MGLILLTCAIMPIIYNTICGFIFRGSLIIRQNHENLISRKYHTILSYIYPPHKVVLPRVSILLQWGVSTIPAQQRAELHVI